MPDMETNGAFHQLLDEIWTGLGGDRRSLGGVAMTGVGELPAAFAVSDLAAAVIGAAGLAIAELASHRRGGTPAVAVDRRLASFWFRFSVRPDGWKIPPPWDPIAGDYHASDGWIRLHTNAPRHRAAALHVLNCAAERSIVAEAVKPWSAEALETAVVAAGGCAAALRTVAEWEAHPQGRAVFAEPLIAMEKAGAAPSGWRPTAARPLAGVKVVDLTRVLAGPVATRFLAGYGADVLRIDPPDWDEPAIEPEVTLGKRCARLDLRQPLDRVRVERLISGADLFIHGYRPEALGALGYGGGIRRALNPSLVDVRLDAYGWSGPWRNRRGFDSLIQMSTGIAAASRAWRGADKPVSLPVPALDHATGYLMAAAAVRGLALRLSKGQATSAGLSLARTAALLIGTPRQGIEPKALSPTDADYSAAIEVTDWGSAHRALPARSFGILRLSEPSRVS